MTHPVHTALKYVRPTGAKAVDVGSQVLLETE